MHSWHKYRTIAYPQVRNRGVRLSRTNTQEVRASQNLSLRNWIIRLVVFFLFGCTLIFLVSLASEMGLTAKGKIEVPGANLEISNGQSEQLTSSQAQAVENNAQKPVDQSFNTQYQGQSGYCSYDPDYYSFVMYPQKVYGPSYDGYYVATDGNGLFGVVSPYNYANTYQPQSAGIWLYTDGGIEVCYDSNGSYVRY